MSKKYTFDDAEKRYIEAEEMANRLGIRFYGNEEAGAGEYEDDWVRLLDATGIITQLEAEIKRLKEPSICPQCGYGMDEWAKWQLKKSES